MRKYIGYAFYKADCLYSFRFFREVRYSRQSGLVDSLQAKIIFTEEFRNGDCIRGIEEFSHLWLIWEFSKNQRDKWTPTVRPPRLGGNKRKGVFASRAPFRPNPLGLSCVRLEKAVPNSPEGPILYVSGADLLDGTRFMILSRIFLLQMHTQMLWEVFPQRHWTPA